MEDIHSTVESPGNDIATILGYRHSLQDTMAYRWSQIQHRLLSKNLDTTKKNVFLQYYMNTNRFYQVINRIYQCRFPEGAVTQLLSVAREDSQTALLVSIVNDKVARACCYGDHVWVGPARGRDQFMKELP